MKVKFVPQNVEFEIPPGKSVLDVANEHGIYIKSVCKGVPSCAECRVNIVEGDYNVFPPTVKELSLIGTAYFVDHRRLSCQMRCFGDVVVDMKEQIEKENTAIVKRPRGGQKKEGESAARAGNIMQDEAIELNENMARYDQKIRKAEEVYFKEQQKEQIERIKIKRQGGNKPVVGEDEG